MSDEFNEQFVQLVIGLQTMAWAALGKQKNQITGKVEVNLAAAKDSIDTLEMLKKKTRGNLSEAERGLLHNSLQDLELNFIELKKKEEDKKKGNHEKQEKQ